MYLAHNVQIIGTVTTTMKHRFYSQLVTLLLLVICACGKKSSQIDLKPPAFTVNEDAIPLTEEQAEKLYAEVSEETLNDCAEAEGKNIYQAPSRAQEGSGLCVAFSALELLEQNQQQQNNWTEPYSVIDFAALDNTQEEIPYSNGVDGISIFNRLQKRLSLASEREIPFPTELFSDEARSKLKKFFDLNLLPTSNDSVNYSHFFSKSTLEKAKNENTNFHDFLDSLKMPLEAFRPNSKQTVTRLPILPFNYSHWAFFQTNINTSLRPVFENLQKGKGVQIGLCGIQLPGAKKRAVEKGYSPNGCGGHALNILNSRKRNGRCEVLISNSWGDKWSPKGKMWLDLKTVIAAIPVIKANKNPYVEILALENADTTTLGFNYYLEFRNDKRTRELRAASDESGQYTNGEFFGIYENGEEAEGFLKDGQFNFGKTSLNGLALE